MGRNLGAPPLSSQDWPWQHIAKVADDCGAHVRVYGFDAKNVQAAARAGFRAKEL